MSVELTRRLERRKKRMRTAAVILFVISLLWIIVAIGSQIVLPGKPLLSAQVAIWFVGAGIILWWRSDPVHAKWRWDEADDDPSAGSGNGTVEGSGPGG